MGACKGNGAMKEMGYDRTVAHSRIDVYGDGNKARGQQYPTCVMVALSLVRRPSVLLLLLLPPRPPPRRQHHGHQRQHLIRVHTPTPSSSAAHSSTSRPCSCCPCPRPHASSGPRELQRQLVVLRQGCGGVLNTQNRMVARVRRTETCRAAVPQAAGKTPERRPLFCPPHAALPASC